MMKDFIGFIVRCIFPLSFCIVFLLGKFCGSDPPSLTVNGDKATIRFLSNDANQKRVSKDTGPQILVFSLNLKNTSNGKELLSDWLYK